MRRFFPLEGRLQLQVKKQFGDGGIWPVGFVLTNKQTNKQKKVLSEVSQIQRDTHVGGEDQPKLHKTLLKSTNRIGLLKKAGHCGDLNNVLVTFRLL